jgi:hypothetical protein
MSIIEPARIGAPLTQGDILSGVVLHATKASWAENGGQPSVVKSEFCLVLSRPCVAAHKKSVIVAAVAKYPESVPKGIDSFEKVLDFLTEARDGGTSPDVFYLGQLPGRPGRFCARLDSFHTIEIPEGEQRAQFLADRRTLTLHPDFARDLHMRIFGAFASLGFDDHRWPSTEDLQRLVTQGQTDIATATLTMRQAETQKASRGAEGTQFKESDLTTAQEKLAALKERVEPYERELAARQAKSS